jgi:hypothetical protein
MLVLDNALPTQCVEFLSFGPNTIYVESLTWYSAFATAAPVALQVTEGPGVPFGVAACPLFVALLYSSVGTSGAMTFSANALSVTSPTGGCLWPYEISLVSLTGTLPSPTFVVVQLS